MIDPAIVEKAAAFIQPYLNGAKIALVLGSGLGAFTDRIELTKRLPYRSIPGFPVSTVPGHAGEILFGKVSGVPIMAMSGRFHYYEGYSMDAITLPVRVIHKIGIRILILTNAAGGVNMDFHPGDLMLISDHINLSGVNPLIGPNVEPGPRFPDMSNAWDRGLREKARMVATEQRIPLREGVYLMLSGPSYETPAEIRMCKLLGADAVGMSTVPEVIVAVHGGMKVIGVTCITNLASGLLQQPITHQEVIEAGRQAGEKFAALLCNLIPIL